MINTCRNVLAGLITAVSLSIQLAYSHFQLLTISRSLTKTYWPVKQNLRHIHSFFVFFFFFFIRMLFFRPRLNILLFFADFRLKIFLYYS